MQATTLLEKFDVKALVFKDEVADLKEIQRTSKGTKIDDMREDIQLASVTRADLGLDNTSEAIHRVMEYDYIYMERELDHDKTLRLVEEAKKDTEQNMRHKLEMEKAGSVEALERGAESFAIVEQCRKEVKSVADRYMASRTSRTSRASRTKSFISQRRRNKNKMDAMKNLSELSDDTQKASLDRAFGKEPQPQLANLQAEKAVDERTEERLSALMDAGFTDASSRTIVDVQGTNDVSESRVGLKKQCLKKKCSKKLEKQMEMKQD